MEALFLYNEVLLFNFGKTSSTTDNEITPQRKKTDPKQ